MSEKHKRRKWKKRRKQEGKEKLKQNQINKEMRLIGEKTIRDESE